LDDDMTKQGLPGTQRMREMIFIVVGASTPIGLLAVNASAFVMLHLPAFRIAIAISALISGLSLNGLTAAALLARASRHVPQLIAEYKPWLIAAVAVFVTAISILGSYWTYQSMQDQRTLPNIYAVLTALWLLLLPVLMTFVARRLNGGGGRTPLQAAPTAPGATISETARK
jgi:hypothetical protein